ncbi:PqqD family protein [Agromyces sp. C10]|uniref:PqqD family protein n=1 Tax=Agromyces sp. C10 TaxID=2935077 RepID=UPI00200A18D5|nr:PqqD family protein [Agromyces sp. C10]MCK8610132.1 PqqD family protein [Agromyces sp. C10]
MTRLRRAPGVAVVEGEDDVVYAALLPDGPIVVLGGGAAAIWLEAAVGDRDSIADRVAARTGASVEDVRTEVNRFVDELLERGLLAAEERGPAS